ncbi:MAG TPA: UvrD-helicase domain-containing protein [Polyangiaceae bacterium]|jgi:DNA helicase-2/ATP-dependent DNA helicase PcrA
MDHAGELNEPQARAVAHSSGPLLIFAGAGSGKTRTITYRIANLLATHRVPPYRILAVTFTNKAAGEMRARLQALAGADVTRDLWLGTFHSVCARLLRRYHEHAGLSRHFVIYDDSDQKAVVARILKARDLDEKVYPPKLVLARIQAEKQEGRLPDQVKLSTRFDSTTLDIYQQYQRALSASDAVDFEDLIVKTMRIAEDTGSDAGRHLRARYRHVLVDEFQDTNLIQYRLVRALSAEERNLCVVGDDDQSIYGWRGADVRLIRGFYRDFPDATIVKLEQNYRSSANIVAAALGVIQPAREREPKALWTRANPGSKVIVRAVADEHEEAKYVAQQILQQLRDGTTADQIAVFYRVHAQSRVLEEAMRSQNLAYQIVGGMKFFERAEIKDLLAYLRLVENPKSDADLLRIINVPPRGIGDKTVQALLDVAAENTLSVWDAVSASLSSDLFGAASRSKLEAFSQLMQGLREQAQILGLHQLLELVVEKTGYQRALETQDSAEADARLGNIAELVGSVIEYEKEEVGRGDAPALSGYLERVSLVTAVDTMQDVPLISLMSVHSAKGLEFDVVFLIGMEEEIFPYRGFDSNEREELDEERRLAYVAITRARKHLFISYAGSRTLFGRTMYLAPSRFLDDLPEEVTAHQVAPRLASYLPRYPRKRSTGSLFVGAPERGDRRAPGDRFVDPEAFDDVVHELGAGARPGARVRHKKFGEGIVESVEPGSEPVIVARFGPHGRRRIRASYLEFR